MNCCQTKRLLFIVPIDWRLCLAIKCHRKYLFWVVLLNNVGAKPTEHQRGIKNNCFPWLLWFFNKRKAFKLQWDNLSASQNGPFTIQCKTLKQMSVGNMKLCERYTWHSSSDFQIHRCHFSLDTDGAAGRYWHMHWYTYGPLIAVYAGDSLSVKCQQPNPLLALTLTAWLQASRGLVLHWGEEPCRWHRTVLFKCCYCIHHLRVNPYPSSLNPASLKG